MSNEREFDRSHARDNAQHDHDDLTPNRGTRSSQLDAPTNPIAGGLLQRKARDGNGVAEGADQAVAAASSSSGSSLPETLMRKFESSLGTDLSSVRVHTGGESAEAASAVGAKAYTMGQDIHFGAGHFDPSSEAGEHLLAHEVAHTVQQAGGAASGRQNKLEVSSPGDHLEHEADRAASAMVSGTSFSVSMASGVQRKVFRDPKNEFSGPSYARQGPAGSVLDDRRTATQMSTQAYSEQYDNTCLDAAGKIVSGVKTLYGVAADIEKRAGNDDMFKRNDKDLMALAKQLKDTAKALQGISQGWQALKGKKFDFSKSNLAREPELPKILDVLKASSDSVVQGFATTEALNNFQANPSRATAKAWANNVGKQFTAAKKIIGTLPFPPGCDFMKQYFEGLLGAPAVYIAAFEAIAEKRYDELDKEMGGANSDHQLREGSDIVWKGGGPVQNLVHQAYTAPNGHALYNWLKAHRTIQGVDMQAQPPFERAKALIAMALAGDDSVADHRDAWVTWVNAFAG